MGRAASCGFLPRSAKNALAPAIARAIYSAMTSTASVHLQGILGHMYALRRLYLDYVLVSPNTSYVSSKRLMRPYKIWPPPTTRPPRPSAESQVSHFHTSGRHCCNNHQIPGEFQIFTNKEADCAPRKSTLNQTPTCVRRVSGRWKLIDYTPPPQGRNYSVAKSLLRAVFAMSGKFNRRKSQSSRRNAGTKTS